MKKIWAIRTIWIVARMTFREAIRRRIVLTGLVLGILFLVVFSIGFRMIYTAILTEASETDNALARVWQNEASNFLLLAGLYAVAFLSVAMGALLAGAVANCSGTGHMLAAGGAAMVSLYGPIDPEKYVPYSIDPIVLSTFRTTRKIEDIALADKMNAAKQKVIDELGKMVVSKIQMIDGITRTLTCTVVHL